MVLRFASILRVDRTLFPSLYIEIANKKVRMPKAKHKMRKSKSEKKELRST